MSDKPDTFLEKFFFWGLCAVITASAALQWQTYREQNAMRQEMAARFTEIANISKAYDARLSILEREIAEIRGQMVGWDTIKRIELFLSSIPTQQRGAALAAALRSEIETSKGKK